MNFEVNWSRCTKGSGVWSLFEQTTVNINYFLNAVMWSDQFSIISVECNLCTRRYRRLHKAGVYSVLVYQETYHQVCIKSITHQGKKSNFDFRLDTQTMSGKRGSTKWIGSLWVLRIGARMVLTHCISLFTKTYLIVSTPFSFRFASARRNEFL
jgi:hypothetical protein